MPWRQTMPLDERARFMIALESGLFSMSELCNEYGISRKTGYNGLDGTKRRECVVSRTSNALRILLPARRRRKFVTSCGQSASGILIGGLASCSTI